jgi:hypothetical protein
MKLKPGVSVAAAKGRRGIGDVGLQRECGGALGQQRRSFGDERCTSSFPVNGKICD